LIIPARIEGSLKVKESDLYSNYDMVLEVVRVTQDVKLHQGLGLHEGDLYL
jgi:hypothetical protein